MIGSVVYELAPTTNNPRNSEGSFGRAPDGSILFVYNRYTEGQADDAKADLAVLTSRDDGRSWENSGIILSADDLGAMNLMGSSLLTLDNGDFLLFYLFRSKTNRLNMFFRKCLSPDGLKWGNPSVCISHEGYYVVNSDRVIKLESGRLIIPAAFHRNGPSVDGKGDIMDSVAETLYYYSDNNGAYWDVSNKLNLPYTAYFTSGLQEPGVIELGNGILYGWARTDTGRQYEMFSLDSGTTWTTPQPSRFTSPLSPLSMKRLPDGRIIAVWNPIPIYNGRKEVINGVWTGGRSPLVYAISSDNGKTFSSPIVIEDDENHGYCYTAIFAGDKNLSLAYCAGGPGDSTCLARIRIRNIPYDELLIK